MSRSLIRKQLKFSPFVCCVIEFTWQPSCRRRADFSSSPSGSALLMKASRSSNSPLSRPQLSSHRVHSCSRSNHKPTHQFQLLMCQHKRPMHEIVPQENFLLFMYEFIWPSARVHYKPGSSFEKPLPVPEPVAAKLWL